MEKTICLQNNYLFQKGGQRNQDLFYYLFISGVFLTRYGGELYSQIHVHLNFTVT